MFVLGSTAMKFWYPSWREPRDIDYLATQREYDDFIRINAEKIVAKVSHKRGMTIHMLGRKPVEFEITDTGDTSAWLYDVLKTKHPIGFVDGNVVLTMKLSHRYLKNSPHFKKTMDDIRELRDLGFVVPDYFKDWLKAREKDTYDYKHPSLKRTKMDFFDTATGIQYVYDHDSIHESVKHFSRPAYSMIKEDQADVFCSKEKFHSLPETIRLFTVLEESYTLALERHQIPNEYKPDRKKSFLIALEKVCTSISSGWWREYAWENYEKVLELYDEGYVDKFHAGIQNGIVKPYEGK